MHSFSVKGSTHRPQASALVVDGVVCMRCQQRSSSTEMNCSLGGDMPEHTMPAVGHWAAPRTAHKDARWLVCPLCDRTLKLWQKATLIFPLVAAHLGPCRHVAQ